MRETGSLPLMGGPVLDHLVGGGPVSRGVFSGQLLAKKDFRQPIC